MTFHFCSSFLIRFHPFSTLERFLFVSTTLAAHFSYVSTKFTKPMSNNTVDEHKVLLQATATNGDIIMNSKPPKLVQICISFILIDFLYSNKNSMDNDPELAYEWRGRVFDRVIFLKELAQSIHAHYWDREVFSNEVLVPAKFPKPQSTLLEVHAYFVIYH